MVISLQNICCTTAVSAEKNNFTSILVVLFPAYEQENHKINVAKANVRLDLESYVSNLFHQIPPLLVAVPLYVSAYPSCSRSTCLKPATCAHMQGQFSAWEVTLNRGVEIKHVHP